MIYFINEYLLARNSSVEHAAMKREVLFTKFQQPAQIVTKTYDRQLTRTVKDFGLNRKQVINMYDYFQGQEAGTTTARFIEDLKLPREYAVTTGANFSQVFNGDTLVSRVGFTPGTIGRLFYQEFIDSQGNLVSTDLWDWRGFKSSTQYFGQNGQLMMQRYYGVAGQTVLEAYYVPDTNGKPLLSRMLLKNYCGRNERYFHNQDDLFAFYLNELVHRSSKPVIFVSDRPGTGVQPLLELDAECHKFIMVPIYHTRKINDPLQAPLDGYLQPAFDNWHRFDGFVTGTETQARQLRHRYPGAQISHVPAVSVPSKTQAPLVPIAVRNRQLLYVGRYAPDRQLDQLIRVVSLVNQKIDNVHCDLYGYGDPEYVQTVTKLISELGLEHQVSIHDYTPEIAPVYDHAQILLNTGLANGGPLAMQEAQAHGLPVISYDFNYGPRDFIMDGQDGFVVKQGDQLAMSARIQELLTDSQRLTAFSEAAYAKMHQTQTHTKIWHRWQTALSLEG